MDHRNPSGARQHSQDQQGGSNQKTGSQDSPDRHGSLGPQGGSTQHASSGQPGATDSAGGFSIDRDRNKPAGKVDIQQAVDDDDVLDQEQKSARSQRQGSGSESNRSNSERSRGNQPR